jgi:uncharacterized protein
MGIQSIKPTPGPFRILSLDGGGAKGFYTLGVLSEIESLAKRPLFECFDLIFGTSTGAIIAALLARGEGVNGVLALYEKHVPPIMKDQSQKMRSQVLRKQAEAVFNDEGADELKTRVGIVATNWLDKRPLIFKNFADQAYASKGSFVPFFGLKVRDAIIASCSAYPFFEPFLVTKSNKDQVLCADGGFCANNPSLYAIADATVPLAQPHASVRLISIGVGSYPPPKIYKRARRALRDIHLAMHACSSSFLQTLLDTNTRSMEIVSSFLFKDIPSVRIDDTFSEPDLATDLLEHDLKKLNRLTQKGRDSFRKQETRISELLLARGD